MACKHCGTEENLVYSGTDALLLGIWGCETRKTCYPCGNKNREVLADRSESCECDYCQNPTCNCVSQMCQSCKGQQA